jgi:hypothetical protein
MDARSNAMGSACGQEEADLPLKGARLGRPAAMFHGIVVAGLAAAPLRFDRRRGIDLLVCRKILARLFFASRCRPRGGQGARGRCPAGRARAATETAP